jgi:hypothetical protein
MNEMSTNLLDVISQANLIFRLRIQLKYYKENDVFDVAVCLSVRRV